MTEIKKEADSYLENEEKRVKEVLSDEELEQATGGGILDSIVDKVTGVFACKKTLDAILCPQCKNFKTVDVGEPNSEYIVCSSAYWKPRKKFKF